MTKERWFYLPKNSNYAEKIRQMLTETGKNKRLKTQGNQNNENAKTFEESNFYVKF